MALEKILDDYKNQGFNVDQLLEIKYGLMSNNVNPIYYDDLDLPADQMRKIRYEIANGYINASVRKSCYRRHPEILEGMVDNALEENQLSIF